VWVPFLAQDNQDSYVLGGDCASKKLCIRPFGTVDHERPVALFGEALDAEPFRGGLLAEQPRRLGRHERSVRDHYEQQRAARSSQLKQVVAQEGLATPDDDHRDEERLLR
jgi:hypothetical protein